MICLWGNVASAGQWLWSHCIDRILDETHLTKSFMLLELKTMPATNDMFVGRCGICGTVGNGHISRIRRRQGDKWLQMANAIHEGGDDDDTIRIQDGNNDNDIIIMAWC